MADMNIKLIDSNSNVFNFPTSWGFKTFGLQRNIKIEKQVFIDGGRQIGDRTLNNRQIIIYGHYTADTIKDVNEKISEFYAFMINGEPIRLYVENYRSSYIDGVYLSKTQPDPIVFSKIQKFELTLEAENPFWVIDTEHESENLNTANEDILTITNNCDYPVYPNIHIKALGSLTDFILINQTDNNLTCQIYYPQMLTNKEIDIDSQSGTVTDTASAQSIIQYWSGSFLKLLPGANSIQFQGGNNADITFTWYEKELY